MAEEQEQQDSDNPEEEAEEQPKAEEPQEETVPKSEFDKVYARAKKAESSLKNIEGQLKEEKPAAEPQKPSDNLEARVETKVDLRMAGYSSSEISELETYAKGQGVELAEVVERNDNGDIVPKSPFLQAAIEASRAQAKVEQATPPSSNKSQTFKAGKSWSEMTGKERKQAFEAGEFHDQVQGRGAKSVE